jgi:hypothetical protein
VLLVPHVLVSLLSLVESEDLLVDDRLDIVGFDGTVHLLELLPAANKHATHGADVVEALEESRLLLSLGAGQETNDGDHAVEGNGFEGLGHGVGSADFENVLHAAAAGRELLGFLTPVGDFFVIDDVVGAEGFELLAFLGRRCGRDDFCAGSFGELHSEHADTAGALGQDPVTGLQAAALQAVQAVPCCETGAGQCAALQEVEVRGHGDEALLTVSTILLQGTVNGATNAGSNGLVVKRASQVTLVEQSKHLVALLEAGHTRADRLNNTSSVGRRYNAGTESEGVESLDDGKVTVVERRGVDCQWLLAGERLMKGAIDNLHLTRTSFSPT